MKRLPHLFFMMLTIMFVSCGGSDDSGNGGGTPAPTEPTMTSSGNITSFGNITINTNSPSQSLSIQSADLTADLNVSVNDSNFKISLDDVAYSDTLTIPFATANAGSQQIYVRFSPTTVGSHTGQLLLESTGVTSITKNLSGIGTPVIHNYVAFNEQPIAFGGGYSQSASQTFTLHSDLSNIAEIKMFLQIDCPNTGCDDWDRFANVKVKDPVTGNWYEIGRYITPYWTGTQQLARGLEFDVTDFKSLLSGSVELRIYIENWTSKADIITVDFDYIEGTPDYPYYAVAEVLPYHINSIDGVPYGVSHSFDLDKQITIPSNAEETNLRTIISGWGHAGPNDADGRPCAEWCYRTHDIKINGTNTYQHNMGPIGCSSNPVSNQSPGNWQPDRAGWCPGMAVPTRIDNLATPMAGTNFMFEYDYEDWTNDMSNGNAFYATSTYVVVKSNTAIIAPTVN